MCILESCFKLGEVTRDTQLSVSALLGLLLDVSGWLFSRDRYQMPAWNVNSSCCYLAANVVMDWNQGSVVVVACS